IDRPIAFRAAPAPGSCAKTASSPPRPARRDPPGDECPRNGELISVELPKYLISRQNTIARIEWQWIDLHQTKTAKEADRARRKLRVWAKAEPARDAGAAGHLGPA